MCPGVEYGDGTAFTTPEYEMPLPESARLEVTVDSAGVNFVGNGAGYQALSDMFAHLAAWSSSAPVDETCEHPAHWHLEDFVPLEANVEGRFLLGFGPLVADASSFSEALGTRVTFYASGQIGTPFWMGRVASGDSPSLALAREMLSYQWLDDAAEQDVLARLGTPTSEDRLSPTETALRYVVEVHEPVLSGAEHAEWVLQVAIENGRVWSWNLWPRADESWRPLTVG